MTPQAFIFIGRSGSGKGTQAELLKEALVAKPDAKLYYLEAGARFREFVAGDSYSSGLAKDIMAAGKRQPDFLAVWMWSHLLVENLQGGETLIFDGTPRSLIEAQALDSALAFYGIADRHVIYLDISREEAIKRLSLRGRADDQTVADINKRLDWFDADVIPAVHFYEAHSNYQLLKINGEQSVEAIQSELLAKVSLV